MTLFVVHDAQNVIHPSIHVFGVSYVCNVPYFTYERIRRILHGTYGTYDAA